VVAVVGGGESGATGDEGGGRQRGERTLAGSAGRVRRKKKFIVSLLGWFRRWISSSSPQVTYNHPCQAPPHSATYSILPLINTRQT
jgi:hypothetical protein